MNVLIAAKLVRATIHVLVGDPPSVPRKGVPWVSVLRPRGAQPNKGISVIFLAEASATVEASMG